MSALSRCLITRRCATAQSKAPRHPRTHNQHSPHTPLQVGSNSHQGAGSLQLGDNLARITRSLFPDAPADAHQVRV